MKRNILPALFSAVFLVLVSGRLSAQDTLWNFDPDALRGFPAGAARDDIVPGEFFTDPPTLENLGFRWYVEGDSNHNAAVEVAYRRRGETDWRECLPLFRVHHELVERARNPYRTGNLFAGSVLFLEPGTDYEVRFTMRDPDGGAPSEPKVVAVATRAEPRAWDGGRTLHVYPAGFAGERAAENAYDNLVTALDAAEAGDIVFLHPGIHRRADFEPRPPLENPARMNLGGRLPERAVYQFTRSGEPGRPIVVHRAGAGRTVIEGPDLETDIFRVTGVEHLIFEDLAIRRGHTAFRGSMTGRAGGSWLTVRRCLVEDVINGAWTSSADSRGWLFADNVITGIDPAWYPRTEPGRSYMDGSHTGINIYGQGHVVCYNRISRFSDSLAINNVTNPPPGELARFPVNIDFYNNELFAAVDDTIEADYGAHNIRVYHNLCYNAHTALSAQPFYGGPLYLVRNVAYGITNISYKWNNQPSGILAYHNTTVSGGSGFGSPLWSNSHLRNNLIIGAGSKMSTGTFTPERSTIDYNGYRVGLIRWTNGREERRDYPGLAEFAAALGHEKHGIEVDYDVFVKAGPVEGGRTYNVSDFDLRLTPGSAPVNAGLRLPNINDDFTGDAPDLGAYELGRPLPHYGPRR